jgi:hypothetical protein
VTDPAREALTLAIAELANYCELLISTLPVGAKTEYSERFAALKATLPSISEDLPASVMALGGFLQVLRVQG